MYNLSNDPNTPMMYRDIGSMSMNPMGGNYGYGMGMMPNMGMYGGVNYNSGVQMKPQIDQDTYMGIQSKKQSNNRGFYNTLKAIGAVASFFFVASFLKGKGTGKASKGILSTIGEKFGNTAKWIGGLFKKKP